MASSSHGGKREGSGAKKDPIKHYHPHNLCLLPTKKGTRCSRPSPHKNVFGCAKHNADFKAKHPELNRIVVAFKSKYSPFPNPDSEIEDDISQVYHAVYALEHAEIKSDPVKSAIHYRLLYGKALKHEIELTADELNKFREAFKVCEQRQVMTLEQAIEEGKIDLEALEAELTAELKRKAELLKTETKRLKLANDMKELDNKLGDMGLTDSESEDDH